MPLPLIPSLECTLRTAAIVLGLLTLGGAWSTSLQVQATPQQRYERSWSAAAAAMTENGLTIVAQDRGAGMIRGASGPITVTAFVRVQPDGDIEVRFETVGATQTDPGLSQRVAQSYQRRIGR